MPKIRITRIDNGKYQVVSENFLGFKIITTAYETDDVYMNSPHTKVFIKNDGSILGGFDNKKVIALNNFLRAEKYILN